ncbi:MAG TPA: prepilin-type cleavage/methylation domain-containing protein, partial [Erwinia persicina]|nr:prepilin-type cleavage/methylation domain-containing protein [Erwinia persicina]HBT52957.1 prepilin-type cleavage/methylation domain-containing protein [Erwinia persicina]
MKKQNLNGFTLLEMMVVLTLLALLSLSGWSGWQRWQQRQQLNDSAQQIQRLLFRLRSDANWHNV